MLRATRDLAAHVGESFPYLAITDALYALVGRASGHAADGERPDGVALERQKVVTRGAAADPRGVLPLPGHLDGDFLAAARAAQAPNGGEPLLVYRPPPRANLVFGFEKRVKTV
jgi:hypothetical protein